MCKTADGKYKFNFLEMICSGKTGETSATGFCGIVLCLISILFIFAIIIFYFFNVAEAEHLLEMFDKIIVVLGIGAALLGTRKISGAIASTRGANIIDLVEKTVTDHERKAAETNNVETLND
jgi:hypothetical protein